MPDHDDENRHRLACSNATRKRRLIYINKRECRRISLFCHLLQILEATRLQSIYQRIVISG